MFRARSSESVDESEVDGLDESEVERRTSQRSRKADASKFKERKRTNEVVDGFVFHCERNDEMKTPLGQR